MKRLIDELNKQANMQSDVDVRTMHAEALHSLDNPTMKPTNPKDAVGIRKFPLSVIPFYVMAWVGIALLEGALKYRRHNYREAGVRASVYYDACNRHVGKFWEGQDYDPDIKFAKVHHIIKAIASLVVLMDGIMRGNWIDDRPPRCPDEWATELDDATAALLTQYPNPPPPYTEKRIYD